MKRSLASIWDVPKETLRARNTRENDRRHYMGTLALIRDAASDFSYELSKSDGYNQRRVQKLVESLSAPGSKDKVTILVTAKPVTLTQPVDLHIVSADAYQALDNIRRYVVAYEKRCEYYEALRKELCKWHEMYEHAAAEFCTIFDANVVAGAYENCTFMELVGLGRMEQIERYYTPRCDMKF